MRKVLAFVALFVLILLIGWFAAGPVSTSSIAAQSLLLALASVAVALWLWIELKPPDWDLGSHVQTFSALFTIVAVFIAAGLYFLEGRGKVRLSFALETAVIRPAVSGRLDQVLLTIRVPVENRGERSVTIRCIGVDIQHPDPAQPGLRRSRGALEEMQLVRDGAERINYDTPLTNACLDGSVRRLRRHRVAATPEMVRPVFMWPGMVLRPGQIDDVHFEIPIRCTHPFVRVLVKLRINPNSDDGYETKTIVPLTDTCAGNADTREGVTTPTVGAGAEEGDAAGAEPAPA